MKMSSKARYGLYVAVELAKRYATSEVVPVCTLAQCTGVTEKYLEQILALMKKQNVVVAVRGANGGYKLTNPPENTTVGSVLRAVEDNLEIVDSAFRTICGQNCTTTSIPILTQSLSNNLRRTMYESLS